MKQVIIPGLCPKLGNRLFQIACAYAYVRRNFEKTGAKLVLPKQVQSDLDIFRFSAYDAPENGQLVKFEDNVVSHDLGTVIMPEYGHEYVSLANSESLPRGIQTLSIAGYRQSAKYFEDCKGDILWAFSPKTRNQRIMSMNESMFKDKIDFGDDLCFIHVRRGDYLTLPDFHPFVGDNYYIYAMEMMGQKKYKLFGEDRDYNKYFIRKFGERFDIQERDFGDMDFFAMRQFPNAIIANSTYSWWAAYCGPQKMVITPSTHNWFGPALKHLNLKDLLPKNWIQIGTK